MDLSGARLFTGMISTLQAVQASMRGVDPASPMYADLQLREGALIESLHANGISDSTILIVMLVLDSQKAQHS